MVLASHFAVHNAYYLPFKFNVSTSLRLIAQHLCAVDPVSAGGGEQALLPGWVVWLFLQSV